MTSRITAVGRATGVDQVVWCPDGGAPDMFLVVRDERADRRWWPLADVLIAPGQPTFAAAIGVAVRTVLRCAGCGLVAVGVASGGCLVLCRDGRHAMVDAGVFDAGVFDAAVLSYLVLVAGVR